MKKYVSYLRVSTKKQGLGLEAQRKDVNELIGQENIVKEFQEKETGTNKKHRPVLEEAINYCKENGYNLVVAKIDRLTRDVEFLYRVHREMKESKLDIKFADMPNADMFVVGIMGMVAQWESDRISERTRAALAHVPAHKKGKCMKDKNHRDYNKVREASLSAIREKSDNNPNKRKAKAFVSRLKEENMSLRDMAEELNDNGFVTARGKKFSAMQVSRLLK